MFELFEWRQMKYVVFYLSVYQSVVDLSPDFLVPSNQKRSHLTVRPVLHLHDIKACCSQTVHKQEIMLKFSVLTASSHQKRSENEPSGLHHC